MKFNIITNISNGVGLEREYQILRVFLRALGQEVRGVHFRKPEIQAADINIFIEVVVPGLFKFAACQWLIPNPEWFYPEWLPELPKFSRILCKTRDAEARMKQVAPPGRVSFLGFGAADLNNPHIGRQRKVIHVAGQSETKNTPAILEAWKVAGAALPPLTILEERFLRPWPGGVKVYNRLGSVQFIHAMNSHLFHLMPSQYEGYGHALHEALGVGAIILTTDAPPMREVGEHCPEGLIPPETSTPRRMGTMHTVSPQEIIKAVRRVVALPEETIAGYQRESRKKFERENVDFQNRFKELIAAEAHG